MKMKTDTDNHHIVILDAHTANPGDLSWDALRQWGKLDVYDRTLPEETIHRAKEADIVLTNKVVIGENEMRQLPRLRYIGVLATGYNVVDVEAARQRGIIVCNVPAYSTESVAQSVFAHLLTITNRTEHYAMQSRQGSWTASPDFCYWDTPLIELAGKTIGIIGLGHIGMRVAQIAQAFLMNVLAMTSKPQQALPAGIRKTNWEEMLPNIDVLTLHCPLTPTTRHLINEDSLLRMKPTAILINTGRGPLVDEQAVAQALLAGRLSAYCADVLEEEPPHEGSPLLGLAHAYITPHIAWATLEARFRLVNTAVSQVEAFLMGRPLNVVN